MEKKTNKEVKVEGRTRLEKIQTVVIVILSLIIVFGLAYVVPELKNSTSCYAREVSLTNITMDEYNTLLNGSDVSLIYLASPTCGYCQKQEPIMKQLVRDYDFKVNYLNTSSISNDEADTIYNLYGSVQKERYNVEGVRTPTILLVQNGKLLDMNLGNIELESLVSLIGTYTEINKVGE